MRSTDNNLHYLFSSHGFNQFEVQFRNKYLVPPSRVGLVANLCLLVSTSSYTFQISMIVSEAFPGGPRDPVKSSHSGTDSVALEARNSESGAAR